MLFFFFAELNMLFCGKQTGGGRFVTKILVIFVLWGCAILITLQLRTMNLEVNVPHLNHRFLLQKKLDPLTRHADSTTESLDELPFVDKSPSLSEDMLVEDIQKRMPSLPIVYWNKNKNKPMGYNSSCAK